MTRFLVESLASKLTLLCIIFISYLTNGQEFKSVEIGTNHIIISGIDRVDLLHFDVKDEWGTVPEHVEIEIADQLIGITGLSSGSIYELTADDNGASRSLGWFATKAKTPGDIEHYFNYQIPSWTQGELSPNGTTFGEVEKKVRDLIKSAKTSIEYCAYNTNVSSIVNELIDAKARGVQVRVIIEAENSNTAFSATMPFAVLRDRNQDLMHNKFIVIDADSDLNAAVVTGSMNFTRNQMEVDPNHAMVLYDQSVSKAFRIEFNEMWGGSGPNPDIALSKFGSQKSDNTPHEFAIGDTRCELYFSPSDQTSLNIRYAISSADTSLDLGLLIFTYWDLSNAVRARLTNGVKVRAIIEDIDNSSSIMSQLRANGANILSHPNPTIYHHKMAIIDGENANSNPILVSGSHNWTFTAETENDENTMIFYDAKMTQLYKRAFSAQWNLLTTSTKEQIFDNNSMQNTIMIQQNQIDLSQYYTHPSEYTLYAMSGNRVMTGYLSNHNTTLTTENLPVGIYVLAYDRVMLKVVKL